MAMNEHDRERLIALLGMLGSEYLGERDNAAGLIVRFMAERSLQWSDVIAGSTSVRLPLEPWPEARRRDEAAMRAAQQQAQHYQSAINEQYWQSQQMNTSPEQWQQWQRAVWGAEVSANAQPGQYRAYSNPPSSDVGDMYRNKQTAGPQAR